MPNNAIPDTQLLIGNVFIRKMYIILHVYVTVCSGMFATPEDQIPKCRISLLESQFTPAESAGTMHKGTIILTLH